MSQEKSQLRDAVPTLFEWAGGAPALLRMTTIFYEKYVPEDPLLGPLFADMSPDHPERVAAWLGEVFGGPRSYSEHFGGYDRMVSRHIGKTLREEQRARWVQLLCRAADDAGLPTDPEWRAAFVAYLEWGSRIAVELAAGRRAAAAHAGAALVVGLRRDARLKGLGARRADRTEKKPTSPDPTSRSASRSTSSRSSVRETAARCALRSTSGHTRRWRRTPRRSSIACGRGRCRATERGPKTESRSSNAGSTRERLHEPSERRSRVWRPDNSSISCQARGPRPGPIPVTITRGWVITRLVAGRERKWWRSRRPHALPRCPPRGRVWAHVMQAGRCGSGRPRLRLSSFR